MTPQELEVWLKEEQSQGAGWSKGDGSDETIGHERYRFQLPVSPAQVLSEHAEQWTENHRDFEEEPKQRSGEV